MREDGRNGGGDVYEWSVGLEGVLDEGGWGCVQGECRDEGG